MTIPLLVNQVLNGLQFGALLFLLASGLTLVLGVMNFVNLAHGSLYMIGAYATAELTARTGSFLLAAGIVIPACFLLGVLLDLFIARPLYGRDQLYQVLATFGLILFFNEAVKILWGATPFYMTTPAFLSGRIELLGLSYPVIRLAITATGVLIAIACYVLINHTRFGMLIRAGATNPTILRALGVNGSALNSAVFGLGAALAGLAGSIVGPLLSLQPGMGEPVLILVLVVIVIGGIGSVRGALIAALLVGLVDTVGRMLLPLALRGVMGSSAQGIGAALASMLIYTMMALVLALRPEGLFPARNKRRA